VLTRPVRQLVLVSGPPASGKTTLAGPLAASLGFALLAKDRIKEALHDALGLDPDLAWSRRLGAASMELLWAFAADAPAAVLEANFWPDSPLHAERVRALGGRMVEVHCSCPLEECRRRYAERVASRHPVHVDAGELARATRGAGAVDGAAVVGGAGAAGGAGLVGGAGAAGGARVTADRSAESADVFARSARPLRLGAVITVDTSRPVDVAALAATVQQLLAAA
jgi:predicted kinase